MSKLGLIVRREYLTRVKKKSFLLATFLTPLAFGLIVFLSGYFAYQMGNTEQKVLVVDDNNILKNYPLESKGKTFEYTAVDVADAKKTYINDGYDMILHIPTFEDLSQSKFNIDYYAKEKQGIASLEGMESIVSKSLRSYKLEQSDIDKEQYDKLKTNVILENALLNSNDESIEGDRSSKFSSGIASGLSYVMGFLMYMVIFIFGGLVMRSVMEEKLNRIVEVIVSTVKPFQLMLGKLLGVGAVGLTQLLIWLILIPIIAVIATTILGVDASTSMGGVDAEQAAELMKTMEEEQGFSIQSIIAEVQSLNWLLILPAFLIYFVGGYFIYSSMFAAIGSSISDDMGEAQQLMLPLSIPVIIALIMIPAVIGNPNGPLAIFGSMFPLLSPILMPARLPFDPPIWQVLISIVILVLSVIFFVWLAGRIYRVGIFMRGKKITFKELAKWLRYNY